MANEIKIRTAKNGYIITNSFGFEEVYTTLDSMLSDLLFHFEGRCESFSGDSFGVVEIHRKPNAKFN